MPNNELFTGVVEDPRLDPRVIDGFNIDEVLPESAPFTWKKKNIAELVNYPVWNQHTSSACVAFSKAKQISIMVFNLTGVWIDFSPASIYQLRVNKPAGGMQIADANDIVNKTGVTLEALMKSQGLTEQEINIVRRSKVASLFATAIAEAVVRYLYVPVDIDRIAQAIEAKKGVSMLIYATYDEYARMVPVVLNPNLTYAQAPIRHEIVGVDYFLNSNGVKRVYINDSAHFGGLAVREFTEDFLLKRCILADALDVFTFDPDITNTPSYNETTKSLKDCLKFDGLFPQNQESTGVFGPITKASVIKFQVKYNLNPPLGNVGPLTTAKLHLLYP